MEVAVFRQLLRDLADEVSLSPLHWILIRRACFYFVNASQNSVAMDKMLVILLEEPMKALRSHDQLMVKIEDEIARAIEMALPDPTTRRAAITLLKKAK
jgi:hypothetical protein